MNKKNKFNWMSGGLAFLLFTFSACSSSPDSDDGEAFDDPAEFAEAETDELPLDSFEEFDETSEDEGDFAFEDDPFLSESEDSPEALPEEESEWEDDPFLAEAPPSEPLSDSADPVFEGSGQYEDYTVQKGDTLMKIAFDTYGDLYQWRRIYELNRDKIDDYRSLPSGMVLQVETPDSPPVITRNGDSYLIKWGDTLGTISDDVYGTDQKWRRLWENNRQLIKDPNKIYAGFYLYYVLTPEDQEEKDRLMSQSGGSNEERVPATSRQ